MSTVIIGLADKEIPSNVKLSTLPGIFDCIFFKTLNTVESFSLHSLRDYIIQRVFFGEFSCQSILFCILQPLFETNFGSKNQLEEDYSDDQMSIKEYVDPFTGQPVKEGK